MVGRVVLFLAIVSLCYTGVSAFDIQKAQQVTYSVKTVTDNNETNLGTAVAISKNDLLLTALHLIDNYKKISVLSHEGKEYNARVLNISSKKDLALLQIDAQEIPFAPLSKEKKLAQHIYMLSSEDLFLQGDIAQIKKEGILIGIVAKPGTSGGGVFDEKNNLLAIISRKGSLHNTTFASTIEKISDINESYKAGISKQIFKKTNNYDTSYCRDKHDLSVWNRVAKSDNLGIQELHALFIGLCEKVKHHDLTTEEAQYIFEKARDRLLGE